MKAAVLNELPGTLSVEEVQIDLPGPGEVLIKTVAAGVCHSDLHIWDGWYDLGGGRRLSVKDRGLVPPLTMGHEIVGEVAALGPEASGVKVGDKRLAHP